MYKNRIRRTNNNLDLQSLIRRSDISFNKRARYVEFVCNIWNEGRFGPDLAEPVTVKWSDRSELEPAPLYNLFPDEPSALMPFDSLPSRGRAGYQKIDAAYRRANQKEILDATPNTRNSPAALTPNQGRGST